MKVIDPKTLSLLSVAALANPRLRKNLNMHPSDDSCCHRFFNAIEPGSYIRPHRHLDFNKDETLIIIRGAIGVFLFNEDGSIESSAILAAGGGSVAADIPHGRFHCAISLSPGTVFFEAKAGPYLPLTSDEQPAWAPIENSEEVEMYLQNLTSKLRE